MTAPAGVPPRPAPVDLARHVHLRGVFEPQRTEIDVAGLAVAGEIPRGLRGTYLRNGPNPRFDPIGSYLYPLDGDAMVHRIELADGSARYTNRFVRTPMVVAEEAAGHAIWSGITDGYTPSAAEVGADLAGTMRHLPDINIVRHGGRLLAMAEGDQPYRLDPGDLATLGRDPCDGAMAVGSTAHPKIDPATGEMVLFTYALEAPFLTWSTVAPDGRATREPTPIDGLAEPLMIHDMALTSRYIVLFACPLVFDIAAVMTGGSLLDWRPESGTRIALVPRDGGPVRWLSDEAFWVWHVANAYDEPSGEVVVDYVEWRYPGGLAAVSTPNAGRLVRARLDPAGRVDRTVVADRSMEFPRVDDRSLTTEHRHVATVGLGRGPDPTDTLLFHDLHTGTETEWDPGLSMGEPVYIPHDDGDLWGVIATDPTDLTSAFHLVAVADPGGGPIASIALPQRVPAGLHGAWLPDVGMDAARG
ncbi:carotenoid oxygenase family protein [uncultured Williamsia sp.]|uniref:carotenoid oxygenase family protein n=1 Tax=uncultured Williamsia sp. TaxID=259311 RepID=UPI00262C2D6A|nr:carotenoid oxygenase family protein [uncultured Williamsia sp.]